MLRACFYKMRTPYQGKHRCFGYYSCYECKTQWTSAYSWANSSQQCKRCTWAVFPYKQHPLDYKAKGKAKAGHLQALCSVCCHLAESCAQPALVVD